MKFGFRKPSLKKSFSARISWKRVVRHSLGVKAPRGLGWFTNPRKALYNRVYNKTSIDLFPRPKKYSGRSSNSSERRKSIKGRRNSKPITARVEDVDVSPWGCIRIFLIIFGIIAGILIIGVIAG